MFEGFKDSHLLLTWGITVVLGWVSTIGIGVTTGSIQHVMLAWTILMLPPVAMTAVLYSRNDSNKLFNFWAVAVTVLMVQNFLAPPPYEVYSYFHLWIVLGAAGLYYTSSKLPPPSEKTYRYAAFASIIALALTFQNYQLAPILAVLTQGLPMIYDWYDVHR